MRASLAALTVVQVLVLGVASAVAVTGGGASRAHADVRSVSSSGDTSAAMPDPWPLYALGSGLALAGGVGWYIRRRK